jgi:hypothetical protein
MNPRLFRCRLLAFVLTTTLSATSASATITFIGEGRIPGTATDQSGLGGVLEDGVTPGNQVGGLGSAIAYTGFGNLYVATPDRGPADGTTSYIDRIYTIKLEVKRAGGGNFTIAPTLVATRLMRDGKRSFTGSAAAFDATNSSEGLRFDPEGVRVSACGRTAFVSDEYGPFIYEFDLVTGARIGSVALPNKFLIDVPSANGNTELSQNVSGRQANRGMEGLAISPDGTRLYGLMQSALIQDGALNASLGRIGLNNRIVEINLVTGAIREFLYQLDKPNYGVNEILAVNDHEFLVIERDGNAGTAAGFKQIFKIDITDATDIRPVPALPTTGLPVGVTPVTKVPFLDLLAPAFGLAGASFPEKIEGLAFGPDLPDGRHLLIVTNDNDFIAAQPNRFLAFAIDRVDLPDFTPQDISLRKHCFDEVVDR